jgi:hypothetical protein
MYGVSSTQHSWAISNSTKMILDASSSLLVGTSTAPTAGGLSRSVVSFKQLNDSGTSANIIYSSGIQLEANGNTNVLSIGYDGSSFGFNASYRTTGGYVPITFWTGGYERLRIASGGNVGIGTTSPTGPLDITSATAGYISLDGGSSSGHGSFVRFRKGGTDIAYMGVSGPVLGNTSSDMIFYADGARNASTWVNGVERFRIDANGFAYIRATSQISSPPHQLTISHDNNNNYGLAIYGTAAGSTQQISFFNSAGTQQGYISTNGSGTTTYATSSDYRLKENIVPMTGALSKVAQLKPVTYKWKSDGSDGQGFIAHELAEVLP